MGLVSRVSGLWVQAGYWLESSLLGLPVVGAMLSGVGLDYRTVKDN